MPEKKKHNVFVYGTLKKGFHNHRWLNGSKLIAKDAEMCNLSLYHLGGFPGAKPDEDGVIIGEIYEVDDDTLAGLDRLEGVPTLYQRHLLVGFEPLGDKDYDCYVYVYQGDVTEEQYIPDGVWSLEER